MAEASTESAVGKFVGAPILTALGAYLAWLTAGSTGVLGSALVHVLAIGGGILGLAFSLIYGRNIGVLGSGGAEKDTPEREAYEALRNSLVEGNLAARLYANRLTRFLDRVDQFFGDAGRADKTLLPRAFWLRAPAPLWTAPALDRCLLLALVYPIATIFLIWAISGHVGPAERALRLEPNVSGWQRLGATAVLGFGAVAGWLSSRSAGWGRLAWGAGGFIAAGLAAGAGGVAVAVGFGGAVAVSFAIAIAGAGAGSTALFVARAGISPVVTAVVLAGIIAGVFAVVMAVRWASNRSLRRGWQGLFLSVFLAVATLICLVAARLLSSPLISEVGGPLVLFLGLLTLLNAPFDWLSLGLTRALLRRGLELGGWWPYALALVDAGFAAVLIAALALTMVVGVQTFNALAVHGGGASVLSLEALFEGIAAHPSAPEYWWLYALLLSTMIPSLVNLVIGGASLLRGIPGMPALLLSKLPIGRAVPAFDRAWIATVLTLQTVGGAVLGITAQLLLAVLIIGYVMPLLGLELLDMARELVAFNLPARVAQLFGVRL